MSDVRPALVDLALTKCTPGVAAYQATILDLVARGYLGVSSGPDGLWLTLAGRPEAGAGLADYEQRVLGDARARLAGTDGAPFALLAGACSSDVAGTWKPFQEKLLAEGRRLGICRKKPWVRSAGLLFLITAPVAILAALVPHLIWHVGVGGAVLISVVSVLALWWLLEAQGSDVLTGAGAALAAEWERARVGLAGAGPFPGGLDRFSLERHAFAIAAGVRPVADAPGSRPPRRAGKAPAGPPEETKERPAEIWSSFSGTWRRVTPELSEGLGSGGPEPGMMFSLAGVTLGMTIVAVLITTGVAAWHWAAVPLTLALMVTAAILAARGMGTVSRRSALPRTATFDGQIIARWQEDVQNDETSSTVQCTAIDDGHRAWISSAPHVYRSFAIGDLVQVTFSPRTGALQHVTLTARPRTERTGGNPG